MLVAAELFALPSGVQDRPCPRRPGQGQGGHQQRLPGHGERGGCRGGVLHHRALRRIQVRHPRAEDRTQLQGFHVRHIQFQRPSAIIATILSDRCHL